jgi:hypothetical protein
MFLGDMAIRPANGICHITGFQDRKRLRMANVTAAQIDSLVGLGYRPQHEAPGYIKYAGDAGAHLIYSSIPIAEDDNIPGAVTLATST